MTPLSHIHYFSTEVETAHLSTMFSRIHALAAVQKLVSMIITPVGYYMNATTILLK